MTRVLLALRSSSILLIWALLELNLLSFLIILFFQSANAATLIKYFVAQRVGSLLLLTRVCWGESLSGLVSLYLFALSLLLKIGLAPCH